MSLRDEAIRAMAECECSHCEIRVTKALDVLLDWLEYKWHTAVYENGTKLGVVGLSELIDLLRGGGRR